VVKPGAIRQPTVAPSPPPPPPARAPRLDVTRILTFGDSLTEGEATPTDPPVPLHPIDPATTGSSRSYPFKLQGLLNVRYAEQVISIYNGGKGGEQAAGAKPRLIELLDRFHPEVVVLMDGVNDLNGGAGAAAAAAAVGDLIREARAHGAVVLLCTIPRQRRGSQRAYSVDQVAPFNEELSRAATEMSVDLVDIYPEISMELLAPDGLHLVEEGNQLLATIIRDALKSKFEAPGGRRGGLKPAAYD
jgi:lysophospholipase L1-like esterase